MNQIFMTIGAGTIACIGLIVVTAMRLSQLGGHLARQEAKLNLILKQMGIAFPPPPSPAIQAIAKTRRVAAVKAYREETGLGLKQALEIIDQWRAKAASRLEQDECFLRIVIPLHRIMLQPSHKVVYTDRVRRC